MLFPSESILDSRQNLLRQMEAGTLTHEQAFQRALELDSFDAVALGVLMQERLRAGDLAAAADYGWRAGSADPYRVEPWLMLGSCLAGESEALLNGILELGIVKTLRSPENLAIFQKSAGHRAATPDMPVTVESLELAAMGLHEKRREEPEEVAERLRPYRQVDEVLDASAGLDDELVDEILAEGDRVAPLLVGVLRSMAAGSLPDNDSAPVEASLAMLGEIGDPAVVPAIAECLSVDDEGILEAAHWALRRVWSRRPRESFEALRSMAAAGDVQHRGMIAACLTLVPLPPGAPEFLTSLLDGLADLPQKERLALFMSVAQALLAGAGAKGKELAWSLFKRHAASLPSRARADLREAEQAIRDLGDIHDDFGSEDGPTVYDFCGGVSDDEDDLPPEPVHRRVVPGRNDPCWCGSGKKYKKCHLEADQESRQTPAPPGPALSPVKNAEERELRSRLIDFGSDTLGKKGMERAIEEFVGSEFPEGGNEQSLLMETTDWVMHDYVSPRLGRPIIEEFLKRSPGGLSARQRKILEAWSRSRYSLFEVQEVRQGSGVEVKDLLVGGQFFVNDVSTSKWAARWDCYLARVEEFEGRHEFTAIVLTIPLRDVPALKQWAVDAQRQSGLAWDAFLSANSHKLRQTASRLIREAADATRIVSAEGDAVLFSSARYKILDEQALRRALDESAALVRNDKTGEYGWMEEAEDARGGRRVLGSLRMENGLLKLECMTRERLESGKALLSTLAGGHLRHRGDEFSSPHQAMRHRKPSAAPAPPSGEHLELLQTLVDDHYRTWPDSPLPALDGQTPRQAMATPAGPERVTDLLKLLENGEEHKRRDGEPWYDVSRLKAELGVEF